MRSSMGFHSILEPKSSDFSPNCALSPSCSVPLSPKVTLMDAYLTDAADLAYSDAPPILIAGSSECGDGARRATVAASGLRVGATLPIEQARRASRTARRTRPRSGSSWTATAVARWTIF